MLSGMFFCWECSSPIDGIQPHEILSHWTPSAIVSSETCKHTPFLMMQMVLINRLGFSLTATPLLQTISTTIRALSCNLDELRALFMFPTKREVDSLLPYAAVSILQKEDVPVLRPPWSWAQTLGGRCWCTIQYLRWSDEWLPRMTGACCGTVIAPPTQRPLSVPTTRFRKIDWLLKVQHWKWRCHHKIDA